MRARGILAALLVLAAAAGLLAGCSKKLSPVTNLPPKTYVNIQGAVDTVNHRVHLYWYGTDPDGLVSAFEFRWVYPGQGAEAVPWTRIDPQNGWLRTDSVFTMTTVGGVGDTVVVMPYFEIRAVDNLGAVDPQPAKETFTLRNTPPVVVFTNALGARDTTYASVTVSWQTLDPDGGGPGLHYRVWLDGNDAVYDSTDRQTFTVPSYRFLRGGMHLSGPRTLYVQAVDDGGLRGAPSAMTWYVRAPAAVLEADGRGRLLVVDDVPTFGANNGVFDAFYKSVADLLPAGTYSVLRPQFNPNIFRSGQDVAQTLRQFKAVLWYRGGEVPTLSNPIGASWLALYQDSIGSYLDGGGNLYVDGLYLVAGLRTPGAFREEFVTRHLGSSRLYNTFAAMDEGIEDSTAGWSARSGSRFRSSRFGEVFNSVAAPARMNDSSGAVRGFVVNDTSYVALWALDSQLSPPNVGYEVPIGVSVPQGLGGRVVLLTVPVRFAPETPTVHIASNLLRRMLNEFGIGIPLP